MIDSSFKPVIDLVKTVATQVQSWQKNRDKRYIYSPKSFKTEADFYASKLLKQGLITLYPSIPIISEEDLTHSFLRPEKYWLLDPIDGTSSWFNGFKGYVSQAALFISGKPMFGIIVAPALDTVWYGEKGCGAFRNGCKMPTLETGHSLTIIDNTPEPHGIALSLYNGLPASGYIESGSIGLKSVLVADSTADLFVKDVVVRDWDLAPAFVILNEVGGILLQTDGSQYTFNGNIEKHNGFIVARDIELALRTIALIESNN